MRSALLLTYGSRGDHEPAIALTVALIATGKFDTVHIVLQREYLPLVPDDSRIIPHVVPLSFKRKSARVGLDMSEARLITTGLIKPVDQMRAFNHNQRSQLRDTIIPALPLIHGIAISTQPCVIISTPKFHSVAVTIAEYQSLPVILLQLLPTLPTSRFPHLLSSTSASIHAAACLTYATESSPSRHQQHQQQQNYEDEPNTDSYYTYRKWMLGPSLSRLNGLRSRLHLPHLRLDGCKDTASQQYHFPKPFIINTYPVQIVPRIPELMACALHVPPLAADYIPPAWKPEQQCPNLVKYLLRRRSDSEQSKQPPQRPVCITFGPTHIPRHRLRTVSKSLFAALRSCGVSNIIVIGNTHSAGSNKTEAAQFNKYGALERSRCMRKATGDVVSGQWLHNWDDGLKQWTKEHVYYCDEDESIQFAWLFPKCRAVICHGGVGTVATALRAGIPAVMAPSCGDQFFWGHLMAGSKLGAVVTPNLMCAPQAEFQKAITVALSAAVRLNVESVGRIVRSEGSGADMVANVISRVVSSRGDRWGGGS